MGLFDLFSKGGKYFGKAIEPRCEYCESGKRASNGDKVLCSKKGLVDAGYHCPKFVYSPLKRIPVKQMKMVGFLEGDYDEKNFDEMPEKKPSEESAPAAETPAATETPAPVEESAPVETPVETPAEAADAAAPAEETSPAPAPAPAPVVSDDLAALAAAADAVGDYAADEADAPEPDAPEAAALSDM